MEENKKQESASRPFNVLCIDGGGMRGLYTAHVLEQLVYLLNPDLNGAQADLGKAFDLICGTSTGSILAIALAKGVPLSEVRELYVTHGPRIFPRPFPRKLSRQRWYGWMFSIGWMAWHLWRPAGSAKALREALEGTFGDMTLGQVYQARGISLCIPTVNASNLRSKVLKTPHLDFIWDKNVKLVDACMASGAAPLFLSLHGFAANNGAKVYIDGGLWANNPALVGLTEALKMAKGRPIRILSVGTCAEPSGDPSTLEQLNWGVLRWKAGITMTEASLAAQAAGHLEMARQLVAQFKLVGVDVELARLKESPKSPEHYSAIGLDRADPVALSTLEDLAKNDVADIISAFRQRSDTESVVAAEALSNIQPL